MRTPEDLQTLLGTMPTKVPLNGAAIARDLRDGYEQVRVEYDVEHGERIAAYLLVPEDAGTNTPAIFCHHQHASNFEVGKSEVVGDVGDPEQAIGPELAKRGYVVLAPDAIAFEERNWSTIPGRAEYFELASRLVSGKTLLAKALHDVSVGIDYLCSLACIDSDRIGFVGHSYGGRMALWAAAVDQRIKASVSNCGCVSFKDSLDPDVGIQPEFCLPNVLNFGDIEDLVKLIAPRALYLSATTSDRYSRGAAAIYAYARDSFPDGQLWCKVWEGEHVFTEAMRRAAYRFLEDKL